MQYLPRTGNPVRSWGYAPPLFFFFFKIYLFMCEHLCTNRGRESQADFPRSAEPKAGLDPTTHEITTWAKPRVRHPTDWATPVPLLLLYSHNISPLGCLGLPPIKLICLELLNEQLLSAGNPQHPYLEAIKAVWSLLKASTTTPVHAQDCSVCEFIPTRKLEGWLHRLTGMGNSTGQPLIPHWGTTSTCCRFEWLLIFKSGMTTPRGSR